MRVVLHRLAPWLDLIHELLRQPRRELPHRLLVEMLTETFGCRAASNWVEPGGELGFLMANPPANWPPADHLDYWATEAMWEHPIFCWLMAAGDPTATTLGRVPPQFGSRRSRGRIREELGPVELDQQLSIPFANDGTSHRTMTVARTGEDFSDEDLELARRLQPLLMLLERQVSALREVAPRDSAAPLTGRELAVLVLLSRGFTAAAIAHHLGASVRTVHKHLEHVYRKLGVNDRLLAVQVARGLGLLQPAARGALVTLDGQEASTGRGDFIVVRAPLVRRGRSSRRLTA